MRRTLSRIVAHRFHRWAQRRQGADAGRVPLDPRRVYIVPTATGMLFFAVLFAMLLGALNYSNNMGFLLAFLLVGLFIAGIHACQRNLVGLAVRVQVGEGVHAGETLHCTVRLHDTVGRARWQVAAMADDGTAAAIDIAAGGDGELSLTLAGTPRGLWPCPPVRVCSRFPLGLFRSWAWLYPQASLVVYPQPAGGRDEAVAGDAVPREAHGGTQRGGDEFSGLRGHRPGEPLSRIAWKAYARSGELLVRDHHHEGGPLWLDWSAVPGRDDEHRLSRLAGMVLAAAAAGRPWGLRLPGQEIRPAQGTAHRRDCLHALAAFGARGHEAGSGGRWQPRPALDTTTPAQLAWLALVAGLALGPHAGALAAWLPMTLGVAVAWRLGHAWRRWPLPGRMLRTVLALLGLGVVAFAFRSISGIEAGSALLIVMMALKFLETRGLRDRSVVVMIAWFVLFTGFLRGQDLTALPWLVAGLATGTLALLQAARSGRGHPPATAAAHAARLIGIACPLALMLFLLFPRLPGPFWALPGEGDGARSGLGEQMSPGDISSLALSSDIAFRVRFSTPSPPAAQLYWRGPVLERFDGHRWRAQPDSARGRMAPPPAAPGGATHDYEVTLEPHRQRWLLPLETALRWETVDAGLSAAGELRSARPIDRRLAWRGTSVPGAALADPMPPQPHHRFTAQARNPQTLALARSLRERAASPRDYLAQVLQKFRSEPFHYTLEPARLGRQPVDDFLFRTREGFCEHYASAFTLLARAAGIPARVVTGYQGGEWNPIGGYWIVRQSDAHAWSEVWLDGSWHRYDPTAAIAPERIDRGIDTIRRGWRDASLPLIGTLPLWERVALGWDTANALWDRWVLAFGPEHQTDLLERLGLQSPGLRELALLCAAAFGGLVMALTLVALRQRPAPPPDALKRAWLAYCRRLAPLARPCHAAETPLEYARAVAAKRPDLAPQLLDTARRYLRLRYETLPSAAEVRDFSRRVRRFRPPPAPARG